MSDPLFLSFSRLVRQVMSRVDYLALHACTVQAQRGDGSLDLKADNARLAPPPGVPIRVGLPGVTVKVKNGARVLLGFDGGDLSKPYAALWTSDSLMEITIDASIKATVKAPSVEVNATTATIDAQSVTIAGGVMGAARMGDTAQCGPFSGFVTSGSLKTKIG